METKTAGVRFDPWSSSPSGFSGRRSDSAARWRGGPSVTAPRRVYFLDERSFPEPEAFWVGGSRDSTVVIQPDVVRSSAAVRLRNGPIDNRVTLETGTWRHVLQMGAGEEQQVEVPLDAGRGGSVLRLEASAGFRPSEHDPGSRDQRFLGVWVKVL